MQVPGWLNQDFSSINCSTPVRDRPASCELTKLAQSMFGHHGWWMQPTSKLEYESGLARYMGKWDTRVAGPWSDMSPPTMKTSDVQFLEQQGLLPWHRQMLERPHVSTAQCIIVFMKLTSRSNRFNGAMHRWRFAPNDKRIRGRAVFNLFSNSHILNA